MPGIIVNGIDTPIPEGAKTLLDVLQGTDVEVIAPCGGVGKCKKCTVLVQRDGAWEEVLSCQTEAVPGTVVRVGEVERMEVEESGISNSLWPAGGKDGYGMSVDLGTTTIAARLIRLSDGVQLGSRGAANPQGTFGADVISRISAVADGKLGAMEDCVVELLEGMRAEMCAAAGIEVGEVSEITLAGNTVMEHIVSGVDPSPIGVAPYEPTTLLGETAPLNRVGDTFLAPCVSGYVGGDITAGMLACDLQNAPGLQVFLDLGTNGELAIGSSAGITACATAAGPVFEGAGIDCGMAARPGAINSVRIEGDELVLHTVGDAAPVGICGSGLIDAVAVALDLEIVDETGRIVDDDEVDEPWCDRIVERNDANAFLLSEEGDVYISQSDVRSVQLAKAAICAGIETLLEHLGAEHEDVQSMLIAGGFGKFLSARSAARIGLFPPDFLERATSVGNTSMEGAALMLVSDDARAEAIRIAQACDYVELSTSALFNENYMEQMMFPDEL